MSIASTTSIASLVGVRMSDAPRQFARHAHPPSVVINSHCAQVSLGRIVGMSDWGALVDEGAGLVASLFSYFPTINDAANANYTDSASAYEYQPPQEYHPRRSIMATLATICGDGCGDSWFHPVDEYQLPSDVSSSPLILPLIEPYFYAWLEWLCLQHHGLWSQLRENDTVRDVSDATHYLWGEFSSSSQETLGRWNDSLQKIDSIDSFANEFTACPSMMVVIAVLIYTFLYFLYYSCVAARKPRIYSQHLGSRHATQLPPSTVVFDTNTPGPLKSVRDCVTDETGSFRQYLNQEYFPTPWLTFPSWSGHLQTVFTGRASPSALGTPLLTYKRELIHVRALNPQLQEGCIALDWAVLGKSTREKDEVHEFHKNFTAYTPTVLICHGLAGGGSEHYVKNLCYTLSKENGYRCVVFNARGCGGSKLKNNQLYCGAYTDDLRQIVHCLQTRLPHAPLLSVGFSLGSNILTKFVGEEGFYNRPPPFTAMVSIANPFDFMLGARYLDGTWFHKTFYSRTLAANLIRLFRKHLDILDEQNNNKNSPQREPLYDLDKVFNSPTLREFDKNLTRAVFGYSTVDDYYRDASSSRFVKFLHVPALFISSTDDPISPPHGIPYDECSINPYVTLVTTDKGGHSMDWFQGVFKPTSWSMPLVARYFRQIVQSQSAAAPQAAEVIPTPPPYMEEEVNEAGEVYVNRDWNNDSASSASPSGVRVTASNPTSPESIRESVLAAVEMQQRLAELEREFKPQEE